jgi:hypothetical protein
MDCIIYPVRRKLKKIRKSVQTLAVMGWCLCLPQAMAADWVSIGMTDSVVFGIDRSSLEQEGHMRRVWAMLDYRQPQKNSQGKTYLSSRMLLEIDCAQKQARSRSLAIYSGAHLRGETLTSEGVIAEWQPVPPSSPVFTIMRHVCEK